VAGISDSELCRAVSLTELENKGESQDVVNSSVAPKFINHVLASNSTVMHGT